MSDASCPFCTLDATRIFHDGRTIVGIWDGFPISPGHALLVPKRHVSSWFDASDDERTELLAGIEIARTTIEREQPLRPDGYNIGINIDAAAGQTVPHLHVHLIPRYEGDVDDPRGGIRHVIPAKANYLLDAVDPGLLVADREEIAASSITTVELLGSPHDRALIVGADDPLLPHLRAHLDAATSADIAVAFVLESGLAQLEEHFADLLRRRGRLRLLTGDYLGVTDPHALRRLLDLQSEFPGLAEIRVLEVPRNSSFHPKAYILNARPGTGIALVGSSNMTRTGLGSAEANAPSGIEWNYRTITSRDEIGFRDVARGFEQLFTSPATQPISDEWIAAYEARREALRSTPAREIAPIGEPPPPTPEPHEIQREALAALEATREEGYRAGLVVMATGLGKTWLAAFDSARPEVNRVLFVAHREEILRQSLATFRTIRSESRLGLYTGAEKTLEADILFASVQTLGKQGHLDRFPRDHFDYVVVDEFHHASARTYRQLIRHFEPNFLLGLTATPERLDGSDILALCQDNLVYRCDAPRAIERKLLSPFHYFGIPDEVDYSNIPWRSSRFDEEALTNAVATQSRAQNAFEQWNGKGGKRTLAFCCSVRHANFMRDYFQGKGTRAAAVHSAEDSDPRAASLERLESGELEILFAVDIFNEGVDLPHVDTVLMLRPTESPVVWMQQFGRGLRRAEGKDHLTVLDYIGNHRIFLLKIQTLHSLEPGDGHISQLLDIAQRGELDLPAGCEVTYDLRAVEILRGLLRRGPNAVEMLELWYRDARERHGKRPTAGQAIREGYNPRSLRPQFGSWLGFVSAMGDLSLEEATLVKGGVTGDFLTALEVTQMTRSYKMLVLRVMLDEGVLTDGISIDSLAAGVRRLGDGSPPIRRDLGDAFESDDALRSLLLSNPIAAWVGGKGTGGKSYFSYENEVFAPVTSISEQETESLSGLVAEIADWRLAEYLRRDGIAMDEASTDEDGNDRFACRLSHTGGRPILFLPNRENTPQIPEGWTAFRANGADFEANFVKVAINVVRRPGTSENVLPDLLRGWFGENAGLPGTMHEVAFERDADEGWSLTPLHRASEYDGLEIGRSYMRADIAPRFGLEFSPMKWQQGFVMDGGHIFLLVTLDKSNMPDAHRYEDHFLSRDLFEWKSQNRHTQESAGGQAIRHHKERLVPVHLMVRERSKLGSKAAPFVYAGELEFQDWEGESPITVRWRLEEPLSETLYERFSKVARQS